MPKVYNKHHKDFPPDAVYVGRPSKWGNPIQITKNVSRNEAVQKFKENMTESFKDMVRKDLKGKDLICYCKPKVCHADVLLEIANAGSDE